MSELAGPAASTPSQALIQDAVFITAGQMELGQIIQQGPRPNDTRAWYHAFLHRRLPQAIESSNAQGVPGPTSRATAQMVLGWSADDDDDVEPVIPWRFRIFSAQHHIRDGIRDRIAASIRNSSGFRIPTHGRVTSPAPSLFPHVKITPWRITNTVVVLGLGIYKATVTYLGQTTAPTTADWIIGVGWTLISYWIGLVEQHDDTATQWFFSHDFSDVVASVFWVFFQLVFGLVVVGGFSVIYIRLYFSIPFAMQQSPLAFLFIFLASMLLTLAIWIVLWFTVLLASEEYIQR
ncbi:hypothetical protein B0H13DRAFT_1994518 [Mycena leptocephala]|nr:hypothetical protein B0H13DRAFT_1994518 [Mycena leptocephala]